MKLFIMYGILILSCILFAMQAFATTSSDSGFTLTAVNGGVEEVFRGKTYTVSHNSSTGANVIEPDEQISIITSDLGIDIMGNPGTHISVLMILPVYLVGPHNNKMPIRFPASGSRSGYNISDGNYFDPNILNQFTLNSSGECKLRLGYSFSVLSNVLLSREIYSNDILCLVSNATSVPAQMDTALVKLSIITANEIIYPEPKNGSVINVSKGTTYTVTYNPTSGKQEINPSTNEEQVQSALGLTINSLPSKVVVIEFELPGYLSSESGSTIPISFPFRGRERSIKVENNTYFDPNVTNSFRGGKDGQFSLLLSYKLLILATTGPGKYSTSIKCLGYYTGLEKRNPGSEVNYYFSTSINLEITIGTGEKNTSMSSAPLQISNLQQGNRYYVSLFPSNKENMISPSSDNEFIDSSSGLEISGHSGLQIVSSFSLPEILSDGDHHSLDIQFTNSKFLESSSQSSILFNPGKPNEFVLPSGKAVIGFECFVNVPLNAPDGIYTGTIIPSLASKNSSVVFQTTPIQIRVAVGQSFPQPGQPQPVFQLKQNYPNPFNPGTDISFTLLSPATIDLSIYNLLGQKMETVFSGTLASGNYIKHWDASGLQGGIYFSRLESGSSSTIKKLILLK